MKIPAFLNGVADWPVSRNTLFRLAGGICFLGATLPASAQNQTTPALSSGAESATGLPENVPPTWLTSLPRQEQFPDLLARKFPADSSIESKNHTLSSAEKITPDEWFSQRAPELRRLIQTYEYGFLPGPAKVTAEVTRENLAALGGKAWLREITLHLSAPADAAIHLLVLVPRQRAGRVPIFLGMNFRGNHTLLPDPKIALPEIRSPRQEKNPEKARGSEMQNWPVETTIDRGYAFASFFNGDVIPDDPVLAAKILASLPPPILSPAPPGAEAGTLAAWAWCFSRALDFLETDPAIDPQRLAIVGHSRNGKAAMLAAALDGRVALVIPSQAGCGGTAPSRVPAELREHSFTDRPQVETLRRINTAFPHWFCANFKAFNETPESLPFEQDALVALCAPRPVLFSCATGDLWSNPPGQWAILQSAAAVYRLTCGDALEANTMPSENALVASRLGFFLRPGKHSMLREDWQAWLDFADRWLKAPAPPAR